MMSSVIKCELSQVRPRLGEIGANIPEAKFVKRRRRGPSNDLLGKQQLKVDQTTDVATTAGASTTAMKRSSRFRGVSRHRWTGRFEAHLWDKGSWNATQRKKGKQVYLGAFDEEEAAARTYDLAAIKYWGPTTFTNFQVSDYEKEIEIMQNMSKEEYLASLRRRSSGFSRGVSKYRGVARHHHNGRWEARIGRVFGNKYLYLGTYGTQEEAAHAYDIAAIEYRGINAVTNFDLSTYIRWLRPEENSMTLQEPIQTIETQPTNTMYNPNPTSFSDLSTQPEMHFSANQFQKQNFFEIKTPINPFGSKSSSPSALGLLLRSPVFKNLVEKNSNNVDDEIERNEKKQTSFDWWK